ncbi:glycosyltransferase family 4 protein [Cyanobacterium sp. IPPAS B-1200]|uniref:glycosyltransferase family 4 protein n=1 Tax=Cyanobacterium sp. IPPAS B-1200 TaxID=1562720 RepID=UPI00085283E8|nr:glycosyltransferase family 4 protein [Cyanobacterium sp. IPPAS B-1200]OEJ79426.1 glycosyl transferase family 1 [Cyanobacterium sp. IPPAS B-1200]
MKILIISNTFPYPPSRGGTQVRTFNLIKYLKANHSLTMVTQIDEEVQPSEIEALKTYVDNLITFPRQQNNHQGGFIKRFANFLITGTPPSVIANHNHSMQEWINKTVENKEFDAITCEHSVNEIYVKLQWQQQLKTVLNIHSSVYRTCKNQLETGTAEKPKRDRIYLPLLYRYEKKYCQKFNQLVVTTADDAQSIQQISGKSAISVISNGVDLDIFPFRPQPVNNHTLIITGGMDYFVNIDAACFFTRQVFPLIQNQYPDATLMIVGSKPSLEVQNLAKKKGVIVTGRVPSMAEYLHKASICVIPMRTGFGIKNKTLEAMATGIPVVASDRGLEGLTVDNPLCALRANKIEDYVKQICKLFDNRDLGQEIAYNAHKMIENNYSWEKFAMDYEKIITSQ